MKKKIGILTHFSSFQPGYALSVGWHERAKLLEYFDQDFDFLVNDNCPEGLYPHQKNCLPRIKSSKPFEEKVSFYQEVYEWQLQDYDAILTADLIYQRKGNFLAYNQAMRNASVRLKAKWYHWIHSGWTARPLELKYPESLKYTYMEGSRLIYLNSYELPDLARMYDTSQKNVYCVYNPKDFRSFNSFHELSWRICKLLDLPNKDIIQIFPLCSTRMDAKGIDGAIKVFSMMKRKFLNVALIFANANARKMQIEINQKKDMLLEHGLFENIDYVFTSDLIDNKACPRQVVADLFKVANLFVFFSWRETVGNVFQEAKISGNLLVLNRNLPPLVEMGGRDAIYWDADHITPGKVVGQTGDFQRKNYHPSEEFAFNELCDKILKAIHTKEKIWEFSYDRIWEDQFKPLLYEEV